MPDRTPTKSEFVHTLRANEDIIQVMPLDGFAAEWKAKLESDPGAEIKALPDRIKLLRDIKVLGEALRDFGVGATQYYIKECRGKSYVIFKGNHRLRRYIRGTRYLLKNPNVLRFAIGPKGLSAAARGAFKPAAVTLLVSLAVETAEFLADKQALDEFLGTLTSDTIKAAIGIAVSTATTLAIGTSAVLAGSVAVPLLIGIAVGVATTVVVDAIDEHLGATKALIAAYGRVGEEFGSMRNEVERTYNWFEANPCQIMRLFGPVRCVGY